LTGAPIIDYNSLNRNGPMTYKQLSPAAQAVWDAFDSTKFADHYAIAAALRAAAEKIEDLYCESDVDSSDGVVFALRQLVLIADELEAQ
jgi:hypothetical protein